MPAPPSMPMLSRSQRKKLPFETVALVLQGGGALGSYQAGVFEGLDEAGIEPDWLAGISIGALNVALIAGTPPGERVDRLRAFWETVCQPVFVQPAADLVQHWVEQSGADARRLFNAVAAWRAVVEGQKGFFTPRLPPPWMALTLPEADVSYYDTSQLHETLSRLVDLDRINAGQPRVSVGAVNVRTGNFEYFDNTTGPWKGRLRLEHFIASGSLPPGFPPVEIDGEFYWDGGLISNTPLSHVLEAQPRRDTLAFQVDLWSALGTVPTNIWDAQERQKDIQYSSRTRAITDLMAREQELRRLIRELLEYIPDDTRLGDEWCRKAGPWACGRQVSVIHLIYQEKEWDGLAKDYEFGPLTMRDHWASGLEDMRSTLQHSDWLERPPRDQSFVTHALHAPPGL
ncbi:conserved hypothetical protein [Aromatoleum aromaticum EbN1]|uniref:PNPLA domain-containing protein n=3 Tax=Aromatoleum aromaticum TaxID=551760 RepID=Q5NZS5_AROAE|nr:conserved hypothetical protein [Aromatoleum aromaticum EbN1]